MTDRPKINRFLSSKEIQDFIAPSTWRGWLAVAATWGTIAATFAVIARFPSVWAVVPALVILGGRQLALLILAHEAAHRSLFRSPKLNDFVGKWLSAYPMWSDLLRYREHHLRHHAHTGSDRDPDMGLVTPYPTSSRSLVRKLARDLFGVTALKRVYGLLLMDFGFITYTISTGARPIDQTGRSRKDVIMTGWRHLHGKLITNAVLVAACAATGHAWLYAVWLGAYFTTFNVFLRIRAIAEHACTPDQSDPWKNTRTTIASPLARLTVAPHRVNYHFEHHLLMTVPYYKLPALHRLLKARGALETAPVARNYLEVWRLAALQPSRPAAS